MKIFKKTALAGVFLAVSAAAAIAQQLPPNWPAGIPIPADSTDRTGARAIVAITPGISESRVRELAGSGGATALGSIVGPGSWTNSGPAALLVVTRATEGCNSISVTYAGGSAATGDACDGLQTAITYVVPPGTAFSVGGSTNSGAFGVQTSITVMANGASWASTGINARYQKPFYNPVVTDPWGRRGYDVYEYLTLSGQVYAGRVYDASYGTEPPAPPAPGDTGA